MRRDPLRLSTGHKHDGRKVVVVAVAVVGLLVWLVSMWPW